jgi:hypothetical protein
MKEKKESLENRVDNLQSFFILIIFLVGVCLVITIFFTLIYIEYKETCTKHAEKTYTITYNCYDAIYTQKITNITKEDLIKNQNFIMQKGCTLLKTENKCMEYQLIKKVE